MKGKEEEDVCQEERVKLEGQLRDQYSVFANPGTTPHQHYYFFILTHPLNFIC